MICIACKKAIDDDSNYCEFCGAKQYTTIEYNKKNLEPFNDTGLWGFKDKTSKDIIIQPRYTSVELFNNGFFIVQILSKYGLLDQNGNVASPVKYDEIKGFVNGFAKVKIGSKQSFIDLKGEEIAPLKYDYIYDFSNEGFAKVKIGERFTFLGQNGKELSPFNYIMVDDFNGGFAPVAVDYGMWGLLDKELKFRI